MHPTYRLAFTCNPRLACTAGTSVHCRAQPLIPCCTCSAASVATQHTAVPAGLVLYDSRHALIMQALHVLQGCTAASQSLGAQSPQPAVAGRLQAPTCSATSRVSRAGYLLWCQSSGCEPHVQQTCPLQASARPSESNSNKAEAGRTVVLVKARPPSGGGGNSGKGSAGKAGKGPASDGAAGEAEVIEGAPRKVSTLWADVVAMQDV